VTRSPCGQFLDGTMQDFAGLAVPNLLAEDDSAGPTNATPPPPLVGQGYRI
jgi:hypothetical protein